MPLTLAIIPLFGAASLVWLKLLLLGWAWVWILPDRVIDDAGSARRCLFTGAGAVLLGVLLTALSTFALGELGFFTHGAESLARLLIAAAGIGCGLLADAKRTRRMIARALPLSFMLLPAFIIVMALPQRGEWIIGGWDPGVYLNQAAALERTGTFYPPDEFFHEELTAAEREIFTRSGHGRTERFPAVLTHADRQSFSFEFFRLTPALFGAIQRSGDFRALTRANTFLALLLLPVFMALLWRHLCFSQAFFASLLLATHPIWLFHTHFPTTEMLQLLLLCGLFFTLIDRPADRRMILLPALFAGAAVLNRFSFLPFAGILLTCAALGDAFDCRRQHVIARRFALIAACGIAAVIDYRIAPASIAGWSITPMLLLVTAIGVLLALTIDGLFSWGFIRNRIRCLKPRHLDLAACCLLLLMIASWFFRDRIGTPQDITNLQRLLPFTGRLHLMLAGAGLLALLFWRPRLEARVFFPLCLFLLASGWLLIMRKSITDWFPWATRRFLPYLVPFTAISAGYLLGRLWQQPRAKWPARATALVLAALALLETAPAARRAWRYTSYNGLAAEIENVAAQIESDDILIADHPWWGTPLALKHGLRVLNAREVWLDRSGSGERMRAMLPVLERLSAQGRRIRFLTSTDEGMGIYRIDPEQAALYWSAPLFEYQEIVQHAQADRFQLRSRQTRFRIFTFMPQTGDRQPEVDDYGNRRP